MRTTRRDFLKTVSAVAAGSLVASPVRARPAIKKGLVFDMVSDKLSYADRFKMVRDSGFEVVQALTEPDERVTGNADEFGELVFRLPDLPDPASGETKEISLGNGSAPHGVIVGPDGAPWVTDGGLNAIVRVDARSSDVKTFLLPTDRPNANLNTAVFDSRGVLWFTGQNGIVGRLNPVTGAMDVFDAPRGRGPYGMTAAPTGDIYFASLAGSYVGRVNTETGEITVLEPPTPDQGARRVWADSAGRIWVSEWNAGQVAVFDPKTNAWREWRLPGHSPQAYDVYVDEADSVWLTDFGGNALVRFDPKSETFESFPLPDSPGEVRQLLGRPGEAWGAESAADRLVVVRY